ncbi:MAG: hypothetical protein LBU22_01820 [Dysgonamonadaceae bacterium]|jgi:uncharacterized protein YfaS (alpha-2-macroglobulin family)|nr:hypothetical protein [Dysgonamonadaceae bacterium]
MKTNFLLIIVCFVTFSATAQLNKKERPMEKSPYESLWNEVAALETKSLPQSALEIVNQIYNAALNDGNSPELLKALILQLKYESAIDKDKLPDKITALEAFIRTDKHTVEQAVLYSLLMELYYNYYMADAYKINQRTAIDGDFPEDIREWSGNFFIRKITDCLNLSLQPAKELQETDVLQYREILSEGDDSRILRPSLYDFLVHRGIDFLTNNVQNSTAQHYFSQTKLSAKENFAPAAAFVKYPFAAETYDFVPQILNLYRQLLAFRLESKGQAAENNAFVLLMTDLDRLNFVYANTSLPDKDSEYTAALKQLEKQYVNNGFCVEILAKEAAFYYERTRPYIITYNSEQATDNQIVEDLKKVYEICTDGIKKYPDYARINLLRNSLNQITLPSLTVNSANTVYPGKDLELKITYKNSNHLRLEIYKIKAPVSVYPNSWSRYGQYEKSGSLLTKETINLPALYPYLEQDTTIKIPMKELGNYEYVIYADSIEGPINQQFSVSRLATVSKTVEGKREYLVVDYLTGKPVAGAKIQFYKRKINGLELNVEKMLLTDKLGLVSDKGDRDVDFYNVTYGNDTALINSPLPWVSVGSTNQEAISSQLKLFTDRNIYRPGQTVFFKGIAYVTGKDMQQTSPGKIFTLIFRDANYKEISKKTFTSNEFGSFSGEFVIPQGLLTGNFSIQSEGNAYTSFRVEEYKRPTFHIQLDKIETTYRLGDEITLSGEAQSFSGVYKQDIDVRYRITRRYHWLCSRRWGDPVQIANGSVRTGADGKFNLSFLAEKAFEDNNLKVVSYSYDIEVTVTDTNGETQNSITTVNVGDKSMYMTINQLNDLIDKSDMPAIRIAVYNLNTTQLSKTGAYEIYSLQPDDNTKLDLASTDWRLAKKVLSGNFESGKELDISALKMISSGRYRLIAVVQGDSETDKAEMQQDFSLVSTNDKKPPYPTYQWMMTPKITCAVGETAEIIYGSSAKNAYVLYEIYSQEGKKLSVTRFTLNDSNKKIEIPFSATYGEGISVCFTLIKEGKLYTKNVSVMRKQPDKKLTIKAEVFRNKLLPGQAEEWRVSIKDAENHPVSAELLAGMYDASLDKIYSNFSWNFSPVPKVSVFTPNFAEGAGFADSNNAKTASQKSYFTSFSFDTFDWFGFTVYGGMVNGNLMLRGAAQMKTASAAAGENGMMIAGTVDIANLTEHKVINVLREEAAVSDDGITSVQQENIPVQVRQNFNESAFFYPQLRTNEAGETLISFTVPESNTTWKFMGLAHTKNLEYGQIVETAISQKQLMVAPNIPRFIRQGDKTTIITNIANLSESAVSGTVDIECFDPNSGQTLIVIPESEQTFRLDAGKSLAVSWTFDVPTGIDMTALKIVARTAEFSDGEQHLLPILPNRMLVTESLPLTISGGQTQTFSFDKMKKNTSPSLENYRLTLEYTDNPVWYAVQALPTLSVPQSDNALSWFSVWYANTLAAHIANTTPKIRQIIDTWNKQGGTKETLLSNLEKNQELKAVLLEETPWVLAGHNETEQKQRLSLLFDLNRSNNLSLQAIEKLRILQTEEGGWTWFKGMGANVYITQWMLYGIGELENSKGLADIQDMKERAIRFIDSRFKRNFDRFKESSLYWKESKNISTYELEYLLVRSLYKDIPLGETEEAAKFYTALAEKYWANNTRLYDRAIAAIILQRAGKTKAATAIVQSLREHASHKPDLGMFWANNSTKAFMFQSVTTVHNFIMEAFYETGCSPKEMDEMKRWLLQQKRTQEWESVPATVDAIRMLLKTGANWLESEGKTTIQWDEQTLDLSKADAGSGYIKVVKTPAEIRNPKENRVTISKESVGPAWGALYWQYFEDLDKIQKAKTNLNVEKTLFIERLTSAGKTLTPVTEANPMKVGDKIVVRLTVRTDRDFEYVLLKDMRAACFEPVEQLSGIRWAQSTVYYQTPRDASMNYYFYNLPKGTYVFEYALYATSPGNYSNGVTTIQCMYAPEFVSHSSGGRVLVE